MTQDPYDQTSAYPQAPHQYGPQEQPYPLAAFLPQAPPPRKPRWHWAVLAAAVVFLGTGGWFAYDRLIKTDPGIAACEAFRDDKKLDGGVDKAAGEKMTQAQYLQMRSVFQGSRYDDIRTAGTKMIDVLWQVEGLGENPGLGALVYVGPMMGALTDFQSACANHNIVIKMPNMSGN